MCEPVVERWLQPVDCFCLLLLCCVLYGYSLVQPRVLTTHEAVHCQNVREMLADHDWVIPHYGGRPWLERPPLPHWITGTIVALVGRFDWEGSYRLSAMVMGTLCVVLVAWIASIWFGRIIGLLS